MERSHYLDHLKKAFRRSPVVAILGPRQCGKTTLAKHYFNTQKGQSENYFDLENPTDLMRLTDPMLALEDLEGLIIIDEIQRQPELFPVLRVLVDQKKRNKQFLILGSASRDLIQQSSESLAGRIHLMELTPFQYQETQELEKLWIRGGFPLSYLAKSESASQAWRKDYITTFLERDIPNLGIKIPSRNLRRFWMMLTHVHGQLFNASDIGNSLDLSHSTVKRYCDLLTGTFMVRQLSPWFENIAKRQVKTPKIYIRDSGLLHTLLGVPTKKMLLTHPKLGASWEGFALESVIQAMEVSSDECFFWAVHNQAEIDLLIFKNQKRIGFEFKHTKTPKITPSMNLAYEYLKLDHFFIIYPGKEKFKISTRIECIPLDVFLNTDF